MTMMNRNRPGSPNPIDTPSGLNPGGGLTVIQAIGDEGWATRPISTLYAPDSVREVSAVDRAVEARRAVADARRKLAQAQEAVDAAERAAEEATAAAMREAADAAAAQARHAIDAAAGGS